MFAPVICWSGEANGDSSVLMQSVETHACFKTVPELFYFRAENRWSSGSQPPLYSFTFAEKNLELFVFVRFPVPWAVPTPIST